MTLVWRVYKKSMILLSTLPVSNETVSRTSKNEDTQEVSNMTTHASLYNIFIGGQTAPTRG